NNNTNQKTLNYNCKKDKKAEKKVIKKNLIGKPMDFVHLNHIGVNENNSFKILLNDQNEHVKMIVDVFKQLNIKPNKQSVEYADSFITYQLNITFLFRTQMISIGFYNS
ncbi:unnamed protein product, partial [Brachionus calyciflorus]